MQGSQSAVGVVTNGLGTGAGGGGGGGVNLSDGIGGAGGNGGNGNLLLSILSTSPGGTGGSGGSVGSNATQIDNAGAVAGGAGNAGTDGTGTLNLLEGGGGGGGGAGGSGLVVTGSGSSSNSTTGTITGGAGGHGGSGDASGNSGGGGGGGGSGGVGLLLTGDGSFDNAGQLAGGTGGFGGTTDNGGGGSGGDGGQGAALTNGGSLINSGSISGGNGGIGGASTGGNGSFGNGGAAITGTNLSIINSGTISGGLSGNGSTRAEAIQFTGGTNSLEIRTGSNIIGNVNATAGTNALILGGTVNDSFDTSTVGSQYLGFSAYRKTGNGTWALTGSTSAVTPWTIDAGTLSISAAGSLGAAGSSLTFNGGTLQFSNTFDLASGNAIVLAAGGGSIDTNTFDTSISQPVSGTGNLMVYGLGQLTLAGANTYSGTTTIGNATTLNLGPGGAIADSSGVVDNGAFDISATSHGASVTGLTGTGTVYLGNQTLTLTSASGTFAGNISGRGGLVLTGGTETLAGTSTYAGNTSITAGTLALAGASSIASSSSLIDNGRFDISGASGNETIAALTGSGAGAVALGANNLIISNGSGTFAGTIAGAGGLQLAGGTTTLAGTSTYAGNTSITAGTLALAGASSIASSSSVIDNGTFDISGASGNETIAALTGSGAGAVALGANNLIISNGSGTFAGTIAGAGGLQLAGGTTTLAGTSTYAGNTSITAGTLALAGASSIASSSSVIDNGRFDISGASGNETIAALTGSGAGAVALGANNLIISNGSGTFAGTIAGAGGLQLAGGTTTLAGTSTYAGNTSITAGTLALAGASSIASSSSLIDDGTFDISGASGNETIAALTGSGAGTVALGANNLIISNGSGTFAGTIAGTGGLQLAGGTTTLAGTSTYAGNTSITGGTLLVSNDSALGAAGGNLLLSSGGTLGAMSPFGTARLIDVANTGGSLAGPAGTSLDPTTANALTLTGTLNLAGTLTTRGTVIDNATSQTNTGTGGTPVVSVANGLFEVGDSIHGSTVLHAMVTVDASAILRGHGTIAGDVANNGGIVAPGGTIGVMTVTGNYAQNPASTLSIEITPNDQAPGISYSQLAVTGSVQLAGGLAVNADSGIYRPGSRYDIVHSGGGVSGQFSTVAYNSALASYLLPQVQYTADNVYLSLNVGPLAFSSGSGVAGNAYIINQDILDTTDAVLASRKGFWLHGLGSFGQANNGNITDGGAIIGYGARIRPGFLLGVAVAGTASSSNTAYQQISNRQISLSDYGIYRHGPWRIALTLGLGHLGVNSRRSLVPSGLVATGTGHGWFLGSGVNASYTDHIDRGFIRPFVAARYLHVSQEGFAEHGAGLLDLAYGRQGNDLGAISAGARAGYQIRTFGLDLEPWIEVGGTSYLGNRLLASTETLGTEIMPVSAQAAPSATLDTGLGLTLRTQHGWKGRLVYISRRGDNTSLNAFNFTATCNW
ncbi:autotransporter-associated beta strand repeat-containing protein [Acidiphilium multivorum]|uniref:autotransporter-associated beta strand repeat-containing protein n=1 Tax=Acidiphilium multivorum TaxID=62140 RepID=UPI0039C9F869